MSGYYRLAQTPTGTIFEVFVEYPREMATQTDPVTPPPLTSDTESSYESEESSDFDIAPLHPETDNVFSAQDIVNVNNSRSAVDQHEYIVMNDDRYLRRGRRNFLSIPSPSQHTNDSLEQDSEQESFEKINHIVLSIEQDTTSDVSSVDSEDIKQEPITPVVDQDIKQESITPNLKQTPWDLTSVDSVSPNQEILQWLANMARGQSQQSSVNIDGHTPSDLSISLHATVDFRETLPDFRHAIDPLLPPANLSQVPQHTPVAVRRLHKHQQSCAKAQRLYDSVKPVVDTNLALNNKKRSANDVLTPRSAVEQPKRARQTPPAPSYSPITPTPSPLTPAPTSTSTTASPPTTPTWPGQFTGLTSPTLASTVGVAPVAYIFGDVRNANGFYANTRLFAAPSAATTDLSSRADAPLLVDLDRAATLAASHKCCSHDQEFMRYQCHNEAAWARLHGLSVGEYRYRRGHMTVEECVAARVCVCWAECACAAFCTRYPDMMCPCSEHIVLQEDA
jgi:hypothetical protein